MTKKLSYEEWEKWSIETEWKITEDEIEGFKDKYYSGLNAYEEWKKILKDEYEQYCKEND